MKKVLITATVQSHIAQFHKPLIKMLQDNGYEVHVAARDNLSEKNGLLLNEPTKVFDVPFERSPLKVKNIKAYYYLKKILEKNSYDILHCNTPMGGVLSRIAANKYRKRGMRVIYTAHGFHFYKGAPVRNWLIYYPIEKVMANLTDILITITKEDYNLAKTKLNTDVRHIHGVGVNPDRYYPISEEKNNEMRERMGYKKTDYIILCTGELNNNKNQEAIIRSMPELIKKYNNVKLLLAGNGPLNDYLHQLCISLKLVKNVEFLGYRTDLEKYVSISDLIVSASKREGLPLNIIEAMLSKKTVIASKNRGHNELIANNLTGKLIDFIDNYEFSNKVIEFIENPKRAETIAENGLNNIQKYTSINVVKELKNIYKL